jgi:hypothetical protein
MTALGTADGAFVPDLTLWHRWHSSRGTLPEAWKGMGIPEISRELGAPAWVVARPWRLDLDGASAETAETATERITKWSTGSEVLQAKWVRGPDGDWWQAEYPVKSAEDLAPALALVEARRYTVDGSALAAARSTTGPGDLLALELPMRPYSELFHNFLGWAEGLMMLLEQPEAVQHLLDALESRLRDLVVRVAAMPADLALSPDNLDGSFIPAAMCEEHLAPSYRRTCETLHAAGKRLVVHVGGMCRGLLPGLAGAGVDAVEGVCGAPQSDASIAEARTLCGPGLTLWGGVAQDLLLPATGGDVFERGARTALAEARANGPVVLGAADRVPVGAAPDRLAALARMARDG